MNFNAREFLSVTRVHHHHHHQRWCSPLFFEPFCFRSSSSAPVSVSALHSHHTTPLSLCCLLFDISACVCVFVCARCKSRSAKVTIRAHTHAHAHARAQAYYKFLRKATTAEVSLACEQSIESSHPLLIYSSHSSSCVCKCVRV